MPPTVKKSKKPSSKRRTIRIKKLKRKLKIKKIEVKKVISVKRKTPNKEMAKIVLKKRKKLDCTLGIQMVLMPEFKDEIIPFAKFIVLPLTCPPTFALPPTTISPVL